MGVLQSSIHFQKLNGVIQNQSGYQIKYKITEHQHKKTIAQSQQLEQILDKSLQQLNILEDKQNFIYGGLVLPYSTKYFSFKEIQKTYRFSVYAIRISDNNQSVQQMLPLQKQRKISSQKSICVRVTPQLKVIHLNNNQIKQLQSRKYIQSLILKQSNIVTDQLSCHRLVTMFSHKYPQNISLLYKASENDFNVQKFYEQHGYKDNILLICRTDKDKVIGGYSRMALIPSKQKQGDYDDKGWTVIHDSTMSSFIFSVTCNDVFRLRQNQGALYYNKDNKQICFGKDQLRINNNGDKSYCLTGNINTNYQNHNYNNDTQSYRLLNGNDSAEFITKEWEIWRLDYGQDEDNGDDFAIVADV